MANINGKIKSDVVIMDDTYDVSVAIPTGRPIIAKNPYVLTIYNEAEIVATPVGTDVPMLAQIAASYDVDSKSSLPDNFYMQLSPPPSILPNIKDSGDPLKTTFAIKNISIEFATGKYVQGSVGAVKVPGSVEGTKPA